ncbi:NAD(P)/FAD-dependent oxidoreductase [Pseudomonas sp. MPB26]|uniref:NAD(P)/FAD-dependent oxidoreductase n=1 Tax=Pseudomonas sp. MPB26 TaxID=3388491 RepID=UPI003984B417
MAPSISPVQTSVVLPAATTVVVIGGGIIGLTAALSLAERGIPVTVLEKGRIAGEQSSRNLGWIRKMGRAKLDLPLSIAAEKLWGTMAQRLNADVGYRQTGILYTASSASEMASHQEWLNSVADASLDSRLVTAREIADLSPGCTVDWAGGIYTASDGRAEPTLASSAIARAAIAKGVIIVENCAVRTLSMSAGRVSGVVTERGEVRCDNVILSGGMWSRRFLATCGVPLLTLPVVASVLRTAPLTIEGMTEVAVGTPDISFRKHLDGGYVITNRGAFMVPIVPDSLLIGHHYFSTLRSQWKNMNLSLGREFMTELALSRRSSDQGTSAFEQRRTIDPNVNHGLNRAALRNLTEAWPAFKKATIELEWAGMIDVTPDGLPVISPVDKIPGLTLASGFSGHGFGTSPAAGQLVADLVTGDTPIVNPAPYHLKRQHS